VVAMVCNRPILLKNSRSPVRENDLWNRGALRLGAQQAFSEFKAAKVANSV